MAAYLSWLDQHGEMKTPNQPLCYAHKSSNSLLVKYVVTAF